MKEAEKISNIILAILGVVLSVDLFLVLFFNIGTEQEILTIGYFISFIILSTVCYYLCNFCFAVF